MLRIACLFLLVACSSDAPPPARATPPPATSELVSISSSYASASASSSASAPHSDGFVGVWRPDVQAHFDKAGSDPDEKRLALAIARAHLELEISAEGRFELRSTQDASAAIKGVWYLLGVDGNGSWLIVKTPGPPEASGSVRLVLRDADHLEYYKQIGDPPHDDHVIFFARAKK
jgi:hypothetical protein